MRFEYAFLADAAAAHEGKFFVNGGGWTRLTPPRLPWIQPLAILIKFHIEPDDVERGHELHLTLDGPTGPLLGPTTFPLELEHPAPVIDGEQPGLEVALTYNGFQIQNPGAHLITLDLDQTERLQLTFGVADPTAS